MTGRKRGTAIARAVMRERLAEQRAAGDQEHRDPGRPKPDGTSAGERHAARIRNDQS